MHTQPEKYGKAMKGAHKSLYGSPTLKQKVEGKAKKIGGSIGKALSKMKK